MNKTDIEKIRQGFFSEHTEVIGKTTMHYEYKTTDPLALWQWLEQTLQEYGDVKYQEGYEEALEHISIIINKRGGAQSRLEEVIEFIDKQLKN